MGRQVDRQTDRQTDRRTRVISWGAVRLTLIQLKFDVNLVVFVLKICCCVELTPFCSFYGEDLLRNIHFLEISHFFRESVHKQFEGQMQSLLK